ncbi:hypothetical protein V501_05509 [Pseudogymnoascus sp. VKM F-4519 (FW-2642)]|nr:hypothetical protein V501_05509 [Pseudogymnoascus sp. VKM F-4519 (FW-2642)]
MRLPSFLVNVSIVTLAAALTPYDSKECSAADSIQFNELIPEDVFVRCAETTYECNSTIHGGKWFKINSTNEPVPADCKKDLYMLHTAAALSGPLAMPGLTELSSIAIRGGYVKEESTGKFTIEATRISTIDLPDLVNVTGWFLIDNTDSISSLNVPKLKHVADVLQLNFTGGPALNLSFPSLIDVGVGIQLHGEIDALDLPALNSTGIWIEAKAFDLPYENRTGYSISVNSTGNLDCNAFAASVVNATNYDGLGVTCNSKKGSVTLKQVKPPEDISAASKIRGDFLGSVALLAFMFAL